MPARVDNSTGIQRLLIVSGCAGAGKSVVLHRLEDAGYHCVDNLPLDLLLALVASLRRAPAAARSSLVAVCIDVRSTGGDLSQFGPTLAAVRQQQIPVSVLYVDTNDDVLIQRFNASRRNHPLVDPGRNIGEAIMRERKLLEPIHALADQYIDTSHFSVPALQDWLVKCLKLQHTGAAKAVLLQSFGYQHGVPRDADLVFDVRCLPNPYWDETLRQLTGQDRPVKEFMASQGATAALANDILGFIEEWLPAYCKQRSYVSIGIGCTGGQHRSVYMAERLYQRLSLDQVLAQIRHRDIGQ